MKERDASTGRELPPIKPPKEPPTRVQAAESEPGAGGPTGGLNRTVAIISASAIVAAALLGSAIIIASGGDSGSRPAGEAGGRRAQERGPAAAEGSGGSAGAKTDPNQTIPPPPSVNRQTFEADLAAGHLEAVAGCAHVGVYRRLPVRPGGGYASSGFACNTAAEALVARPADFYRDGGSVPIEPYTSTHREIVPMVCSGPYPIRCAGGYEAVVYVEE